MVELERVSSTISGGFCRSAVAIRSDMRSVVGCLLRLGGLDGHLVALCIAVSRVSQHVRLRGICAGEIKLCRLGSSIAVGCDTGVDVVFNALFECRRCGRVVYPQLVAGRPIEFDGRSTVNSRCATGGLGTVGGVCWCKLRYVFEHLLFLFLYGNLV